MSAYGVLFDRVLTRVDAERAHHVGFAAIRAARAVTAALPAPPSSPVTTMGLTFAHPLGLAAGFDKNGVGIDALGALGFGHVEIGTVTGQAQPGNPRPRLFRLPRDRAIVNRMGFNNDGAEAVARRLAARGRRPDGPVLGINIGKTKVVPEDRAVEDYLRSTTLLAPHADYLVVNVSSPNTPGLRDLQAVERLRPLLEAVRQRADQVRPAAAERGRVPLLVKIAPDLSDADVLAVGDLVVEIGLDGIIATNTSVSREGLVTDAAEVDRIGAGGLSGAPLAVRAEGVLRMLRSRVGPDLTLIGVGGISTVADARRRLAAGADLVQAYSGFVYHGAVWPRRIVQGLSAGD